MENVVPFTIQIISIIGSVSFLFYIGYLIVRGKLREEYAIFWVLCTLTLVVFSFWRSGLEIISRILGVYDPPNLVFMVAIFGIFSYLLHLSVVVSRLHEKNKKLSQDIALMKNKMEEQEAKTISENEA